MSDDDDNNNNNTVLYDQPTDNTGEALTWDDNPASLAGILYEAGRFYVRKGLFQTLIQHGGVLRSNGKLAVDSPNAVLFIQNPTIDPRSFEHPATPSDKRLAKYNLTATTALVNKTALTADEAHEYSVAPFLVQQHDARFLSY